MVRQRLLYSLLFDRLMTDSSSWCFGTGVDPTVYNSVNAMNDMMNKLGET